MKILVMYDSYFGNTEQVARVVAGALGEVGDVAIYKVNEVKPEQLAGLDLLVVGSPTRGFRATDAMKAWLKALPAGSLKGVRAAVFDTRLVVKDIHNALLTVLVKLFGYAAEPLGAALQKKGAVLVIPAEGFFVQASEGPLKEGEAERAAAWGTRIKGKVGK
jgi:flavodoxin I